MIQSKRKVFEVFGLLFVLTTMLLFNYSLKAQSRIGYVTEGEGVEGVIVGQSTGNEIISQFGSDFKLVEHMKYSHELVFEKIGISFYYCLADPNKEIFVIEMKAPYKAITSKGIVLGESTKKDVENFYEDYSGIDFNYSQDDIVSGIDVIEKDGLRQCDEKFGIL